MTKEHIATRKKGASPSDAHYLLILNGAEGEIGHAPPLTGKLPDVFLHRLDQVGRNNPNVA